MRRPALALAAVLLLNGCATKRAEVVQAPPPPPPPPLAQPMPRPPAGAAANLALPPRDASGRFVTPNSGASGSAAVWHLRAALNVAALGCRDAQEAATVAGYNSLLAGKKAVLARADASVRAEYRQRMGDAWQDGHDDAMTRLYNFFALPPVHAQFCATARDVLADAVTATPEQFEATAPAALARLEAPFVAFYESYDRYQAALRDWKTAAPPRLEVASAVFTWGDVVVAR